LQQYFGRLQSSFKDWVDNKKKTGAAPMKFPFARPMFDLMKDDPSVFPARTIDSFDEYIAARGTKRCRESDPKLDELFEDATTESESGDRAKKKRSAAAAKAEMSTEIIEYLKSSSKKREEREAKLDEQEAKRDDREERKVGQMAELLGIIGRIADKLA
jgi:hypothetical protein